MATINTAKLAKGMGDFRTIWIGLALIVSSVTWAADTYFDTKYMKLADGAMIPVQIKLDALNDAIGELTLEKRFETDPNKLKKLDAYIEYKEKKREALLKKHQLK